MHSSFTDLDETYLLNSYNQNEILFPNTYLPEPSTQSNSHPKSNYSHAHDQKVGEFKLDHLQRYLTQGNSANEQKTIAKHPSKTSKPFSSISEQFEFKPGLRVPHLRADDLAKGTDKNYTELKRIGQNKNLEPGKCNNKNNRWSVPRLKNNQISSSESIWEEWKKIEQEIHEINADDPVENIQSSLLALQSFFSQISNKFRDLTAKLVFYEDLTTMMEDIIRQQTSCLKQYEWQFKNMTKKVTDQISSIEAITKKPLLKINYLPEATGEIMEKIQLICCDFAVRNSKPKRQATPEKTRRQSFGSIQRSGSRKKELALPPQGKTYRERETQQFKQQEALISKQEHAYKEIKSKIEDKSEENGDVFRKIASFRIKQLESQSESLTNTVNELKIKSMVMANENKQLRQIIEDLIIQIKKRDNHEKALHPKKRVNTQLV